MSDLTFHIAGKPFVAWLGPATLTDVAIETPVSDDEPPVSLWLYDAADTSRPPAGWPYERELNGRERVLDTHLTTRYERGITAILMPRPHTATPLPETRTLTFTLSLTPEVAEDAAAV